MSYLERNGIFHGNLRPENIFFNETTNSYIILDRLKDCEDVFTIQANNFK